VDNERTDSYTADGGIVTPFKTIQAAIDTVAADTTATVAYTIDISGGVYRENLTLQDSDLKWLYMKGSGLVYIEPDSGNALTSTANNGNLATLQMQGITFSKPVVITGPDNGAGFVDVQLKDCNWTKTGTLSVSCVNNFTIRNCYIEQPVTFANVNWSWIDSTQMQGAFACNYTDTNIPSSGSAGTVLMTGDFLSGAFSETVGGTATLTVAATGCRFSGAAGVTIPAGATFIAYNSSLRGSWINNGALQLRGSFVQGTITGTGTTTYETKASQVGTSAGGTVEEALVPPAYMILGASPSATPSGYTDTTKTITGTDATVYKVYVKD